MDTQSSHRTVLVHHHIFKNAGTSFNYALKKAFGRNFHEYDLPNGKVVTREALANYIEECPSVVAISGHHIALPPIQTDGLKTISSILIRDPLARIRSIYQFEKKQKSQTKGAVMAKKLGFREFVLWRLEHSPQVFCDYQTLYCSRDNSATNSCFPTKNDLETAMQNLLRCFAVGTVKRYKDFLIMAQHEANHYFSDVVFFNSHLNATDREKTSEQEEDFQKYLAKELGEDLVKKLEDMNKLDRHLYNFSNQILDEWMKKNESKIFKMAEK